MFAPNDGHMAVLACLWLHLRYLPRLRGGLDGDHDEPSVSVEEIEHAFPAYPPRYVAIVLGYLKNMRFIHQWNERILAGPYLAAIDEEAADGLAREALRDFKLRRYLRRRAEDVLGPGTDEHAAVNGGDRDEDAAAEERDATNSGSCRSTTGASCWPIRLSCNSTASTCASGRTAPGKTSLLDAIKLMLGVAPEDLKETPAKYIFNGGGNPSLRAGRAYVKAIFNSPSRDSGHRARVFAEYGRGCERAPEVTAICWITKQHRRYALLPAAISWGETGSSIEEELQALHDAVGQNWMKPTEWSDLLAAAGVSKALLQVVSIKQGETDQAISGSREKLLRRVLELTGKQETLDEFTRAKDELALARSAHQQALDLFRLQERESKALHKLAERHQEYLDVEARRRTLVELELPAVTYRERELQLAEARRNAETRQEVAAKARARLDELSADLPGARTARTDARRRARTSTRPQRGSTGSLRRSFGRECPRARRTRPFARTTRSRTRKRLAAIQAATTSRARVATPSKRNAPARKRKPSRNGSRATLRNSVRAAPSPAQPRSIPIAPRRGRDREHPACRSARGRARDPSGGRIGDGVWRLSSRTLVMNRRSSSPKRTATGYRSCAQAQAYRRVSLPAPAGSIPRSPTSARSTGSLVSGPARSASEVLFAASAGVRSELPRVPRSARRHASSRSHGSMLDSPS